MKRQTLVAARWRPAMARMFAIFLLPRVGHNTLSFLTMVRTYSGTLLTGSGI